MPKPNVIQIKQWVDARLAAAHTTLEDVFAGSQSINSEDLRKAMAEGGVLTALAEYMDSQLPD